MKLANRLSTLTFCLIAGIGGVAQAEGQIAAKATVQPPNQVKAEASLSVTKGNTTVKAEATHAAGQPDGKNGTTASATAEHRSGNVTAGVGVSHEGGKNSYGGSLRYSTPNSSVGITVNKGVKDSKPSATVEGSHTF